MGMPYEMYRPIVAIDVVPLNATCEPRDGRASRKEHEAPKMTVRIGLLNRVSMMWRRWGMPPSRAKANIILELLVCESLSVPFLSAIDEITHQAEQPAMPDAQHDQHHQYQSSSFTTRVCQDLQNWEGTLPDSIEVLDGEQ